jgi:hypothetical protein
MFEIAVENLRWYGVPCTDQAVAELMQTADERNIVL